MSYPKNIVVCLDGTGNQIEENLSNVLKLYRVAGKSETQIVFYDSGVGTVGYMYTWGRLKQKLKNGLGLAVGLGLDRNVLEAYEFIVKHHKEHRIKGSKSPISDNIFIFGFSRGAHTARVLAGLIYEIGILQPEQTHLSGAALTAYKSSQSHLSLKTPFVGEGFSFRRMARTKIGAVKFMGVWDTVSSVFVPGSNRFFPSVRREILPHTSLNPAVETFRHAIAVDEFRRMFRVDHWEPDQVFKPNTHSQGDPVSQDSLEIWFPGCHSDVGGGYNRTESGLAQLSLIWMLGEAKKSGMEFSARMANYVTGVKPWTVDTKYLYPEPDVKAKLHNSLTGIWRLLEIVPKSRKRREWPKRFSFLGFYIPWGEPRFIGDDATLDKSVSERMEACPDYRPINISRKIDP